MNQLAARRAQEPVPTHDIVRVPGPDVVLSGLITEPDDVLFNAALYTGEQPYLRRRRFDGSLPTVDHAVPDGFRVVYDSRSESGHRVVALGNGHSVHLDSHRGKIEVQVTATDAAGADDLVDRTASILREGIQAPDPDYAPVHFWHGARGYGFSAARPIAVGDWAALTANYPARTAAAVGKLVALPSMTEAQGRLILWHGPPGTGKTTAARALIRTWRPWCRAHYITDPEKLFANPQYLLSVTEDSSDGDTARYDLIIAEDCDEYLREDANSTAGASLGRLLNLCDGILGQGLRIVLLLTTNEPIHRLHPAVVRPGRCLANVAFERFSADAAREWLLTHDTGPGVEVPEAAHTLAELYALRDRSERLLEHPGPEPAAGVGQYL